MSTTIVYANAINWRKSVSVRAFIMLLANAETAGHPNQIDSNNTPLTVLLFGYYLVVI